MAYVRAAVLGALLAMVVIPAACGSPSGQQASSSAQPNATPTATPVATSTISSPTPSSSPIPSSSPTQTPAATPSALPAPPPTLYAVLEAPAQYAQNTTVAIAGLDGYARAKTHFTPRSIPYLADVVAVLAPEAHVAAGVVYFVDGRGVVRTLAPSGVVRQVAVFPITQAQQEISFAVSPDGKQLMAAILTFPAVGKLVPGTGWYAPVGPWTLVVERADAGGATVVLHRWQAASGLTNIVMAGWDAQGPVAVVGSSPVTQNPLFDGQIFYGGNFTNLDMSTGLPGPRLGVCQDTDAGPWWVGVDGTTVCAIDNTPSPLVSVASPGQPVWQPALSPNPPFDFPGSFVLFTDGSQLAMDGAVVSRSGSNLALNNSFRPEGWLDAATLIGLQLNETDPNQVVGMAYVHLSDPTHPVNLGFVGEFVGTI
jgi:hypothetical protein